MARSPLSVAELLPPPPVERDPGRVTTVGAHGNLITISITAENEWKSLNSEFFSPKLPTQLLLENCLFFTSPIHSDEAKYIEDGSENVY